MTDYFRGTSLDLTIDIAGLPLRFSIQNLETEKQRHFEEWYTPFKIQERDSVPHVEAAFEPGEQFIPKRGGPLQIKVHLNGTRVEFMSYFERGWYDIGIDRGELIIRPEGNPENYLRVVYAWRCLVAGGLLLHAAGLVRRNGGYAFFGHSTSGKTTISRLSTDSIVLSDDIVILRYEQVDSRPGVRIYGVPFRGDAIESPRTNMSAPLKGLFTLTKADEHALEPMITHEAVGRMAACAPFVMAQPENAKRVLETCAEISRRVPVRALHFRKDPGFWRLIDAEQ